MTTAMATPSWRVTRSSLDTGAASDWSGSDGPAGWRGGRTAPLPLGSGRSAFTLGPPLGRLSVQVALQFLDQRTDPVGSPADPGQIRRVVDDVGDVAKRPQRLRQLSSALVGLAAQLR